MRVVESVEDVQFIRYNHNETVHGLTVAGSVLFTCTSNYLYAWMDGQIRLIGLFRIPSTEEYTPLKDLLTGQAQTDWAVFESAFGSYGKIVRIFSVKSYLEISGLKVRKYSQKYFLPYCHTPEGSFAVEDSSELFFYPENQDKIKITSFPDEVCTRVKYLNEKVHVSTESGKIFTISGNITDKNTLITSAYEYKQLPIIDFHLDPLMISYFGKALRTDNLPYTEKGQVLSIHSVNSLFILFTSSYFLLLNELLHVLYKDRARGEGISYGGRVFISQDSGILREIIIISSDSYVEAS